VNIVRNGTGQFAYVTIGGLNEVKVYRTDTFEQVATIPVGDLPHGIWPSGDGTRVYVGLENADKVVAIDTLTNRVVAESSIGQGPQALTYVPGASPDGSALNLQPPGLSGMAVHLSLVPPGAGADVPPTSVALFDQGLTQVLEAGVTGLAPSQAYVLALSARADGSGPQQSLASFTTNPAGAAIVNAVGPIRQFLQGDGEAPRRYLVITPDTDGARPVQLQLVR
jgi:YVTN family beta-propeller protein